MFLSKFRKQTRIFGSSREVASYDLNPRFVEDSFQKILSIIDRFPDRVSDISQKQFAMPEIHAIHTMQCYHVWKIDAKQEQDGNVAFGDKQMSRKSRTVAKKNQKGGLYTLPVL